MKALLPGSTVTWDTLISYDREKGTNKDVYPRMSLNPKSGNRSSINNNRRRQLRHQVARVLLVG